MKNTLKSGDLGIEREATQGYRPNHTDRDWPLGANPAHDIRVRREGRKRANLKTPVEAACTSKDLWTALPFTQATWRLTYCVRAVNSTNDVDPRLQEVLDSPILNLAAAQDEDSDLLFMTELLRDHDVRPSWDLVREESAEVKILWTQFHRLKIQENVLYRCSQSPIQVVAPKPLRSQTFKGCHHYAMAAHQGVVRTAALIKRCSYWLRVQKDVETWCKRCTPCGHCKATV